MSGEQFSLKDAVWNLTNEQTKERTAQAFLRVSDEGMVFHKCSVFCCNNNSRCPTIQQPYPTSAHEFRVHHLLKNCQQMEHGAHRFDDLLS